MWLKILRIEEEDYIPKELLKMNLLIQYKKAKDKILSWIISKSLDLKFRKPKSDNVISFRINKQFRAFWHLEWKHTLIVFKIDNHQNY